MLIELYRSVASVFGFLGVDSFLAELLPGSVTLSSLSPFDFFYSLLIIVAVVWLICSIVTFAVRFVCSIIGGVVNG